MKEVKLFPKYTKLASIVCLKKIQVFARLDNS